MAPKISLLHVTADSSLLEHEHATQEFIAAADAVFFKAQGLATFAPLHKTVFGLLEGLLDDWRLLNLNSVKWLHKAEVCQASINLWSLNKQAPWSAEFGKMVEHAISTIEQIKLMHFEKMAIELEPTAPIVVPKTVVNPVPTPVSATLSIQHTPFIPYIADTSRLPMLFIWSCRFKSRRKSMLCKGKAKAMEDDDKEEEATQKFRKELKDFIVLTTFDDKLLCDHCIANNLADHCWYLTGKRPCWRCYHKSCLWNGVGVRTQKKRPPLSILVMAKHVKLVQAAKAFLKRQGKSSQFFVLEGYKGKGKAKALLGDSEQAGTKQSFKSMELVDSDSNEEEEEDRVRIIKKSSVSTLRN
ncbi:hypothetical protein C0995_009244 [Termitomyces sp. Mi166|nr:hypothetical protein C0995_009244 [Termitomyces sp. Mi166\